MNLLSLFFINNNTNIFFAFKLLDNSILCIDTWKMFQDFFKKRDAEVVQDLLNDEYNDSLSVLNLDITTEEIEDTITTSQTTLTLDDRICSKIINSEKRNTKEKHDSDIEERSLQHVKQQDNERTPKNQIIRLQNVFADRPLKKNNPRKRLNFEFRERPVNLKLSTIYEQMFDSNLSNAHSAEADCLTMIRCVINIADFFLKWSDNHAVPLIYCKKT